MQSTRPSTSYTLLMSLAWALLALACAPGSEPTADPTKPAPEGSAPVTPAAAGAPAESLAKPTPETTPTPQEPAPAANAEPAQLRPFAHGVCRYIGVSAVDDQTFVHYRTGSMSGYPKGWVHRVDPQGTIAQTMVFDEAYLDEPSGKTPYTWIDGLLGRWPDQLILIAEHDGREYGRRHMYRRVDDGWKRVETLGHDANILAAWPWHSGSILALGDPAEVDATPRLRLAVMRGAPKGPSLATLRSRARCRRDELSIAGIHVQPSGKVTALVQCRSTWLGTWGPDDLEGTAERIGPASGATLHLDARGEGYIWLDSELLELDGSTAKHVDVPEGRPVTRVFMGRDGEAWILQGRTMSRRSGDGWEPVAIPEGSPVADVVGLEHGTPWLLHGDGTVSMQTADGAWHAAPLPPAPDAGKVPKATKIHVVAAGDAWVESKYSDAEHPIKNTSKARWAVYTTREAQASLRCGTEEAS